MLAMTQISCLTRNALHLAADALYDLGTGLEVLSPLCPQLFLEMAGLGNFAKVHSLTSLFWFSLNLHLFFFTPKVLILCRLIFVFSTIRKKRDGKLQGNLFSFCCFCAHFQAHNYLILILSSSSSDILTPVLKFTLFSQCNRE